MIKNIKIFRNSVIDKKQLKQIMSDAFIDFGFIKASYLACKLKDLGFQYATQAGLSLSLEDLKVPPIKSNLIKTTNKKISQAEFEVDCGKITEVERFQKVINTWNATSEALKDQVIHYFSQTDPLNSVYMMAFSGARGNLSQVRQLVGMRGLMADPNGRIIDLPIITNFREGLTITDYIISSYGARKGLVDTALRTADSGYLTRRLIDVAQDIITREKNCKTLDGISLTCVVDGSNTLISLNERIIGRFLVHSIKNPKTEKFIGQPNQEITPALAKIITDLKILKVVVRSPLTCSSSRSICQQCYGWNLAYGHLIDLGEAVGIIAAQSIGEPGTQLTMRTFHTGGVFTVEPSRQIRAEFSGKILYSEYLKVQVTRTQYGEVASISENEANLSLITYENCKINLKIFPGTLILVENNSFIKKNQILFELSSRMRKTGGEKASKNVYANHSGEILLENTKLKKPDFLYDYKLKNKSNCLLWILSGQVYNIPLKSNIQIKSYTTLRKNQTIAEAKLITINSGIIKLKLNKEIQETNELNIYRNLEHLNNSNIYLEQSINGFKKCIIYGSQNRRIILNSLKPLEKLNEDTTIIDNLINIKYRTKTGGIFYSNNFNEKENFLDNKYRSGGTVFYIPESTYKVNKDIAQLYVKNGDSIESNTEIFKSQFSTIKGLVEINKNKKIVKEIKIKPGHFILITKNKNKILKSYHKKLIYPGEFLFPNFKVNHLSFTEIKIINKQTFLGIYPIVRYEITSDPNELNYFSSTTLNLNNDLVIGNLQSKFKIKDQTNKNLHSSYKIKKKIEVNLPLQLIKRPIKNQQKLTHKHFKLKVKFIRQNNKIKLNLFTLENIIIDQFIPNELKKIDTSISNLVQNEQFIEPYTTIISFQVLIPKKNNIASLKEQYIGEQYIGEERKFKERKILLMTNTDYKTVFIEQANILYQEDKLIKSGEKTKRNFIFKNSGLIYRKHGNTLTLHKGRPYLFSQGASIEKHPGDLIKRGDSFGHLVYERARTGDIVQGIPRINAILEARAPKLGAELATSPGIIIDICYISPKICEIWVLQRISDKIDKYTYKFKIKDEYIHTYSQRALIGKFEFINVGQPLNDAPINPHGILNAYFSYYTNLKLLTQDQAAYRSLRKIQALLLNSVQAVYYSQGVNIADKHLEVILKQMTGKVEILTSGESPLLPYEFVDLKQVSYINNCLRGKKKVKYRPILIGITKASLKTKSFLSAASFQYTTRVLTEAAILGKTDWLRGLKENVIIGRLIPAGTGFRPYTNISNMKVKVPYGMKDKKYSLEKDKYKRLKDRIKFKLI